MRLSLTLRLSLLFGLVSAAVLLAVGALIWRQIDEHFEQLDLMELHGKLDTIGQVLAGAGHDGRQFARPGALDHVLMGHGAVSVGIWSADGRLLYRSGSAEIPSGLMAREDHRPWVWEAGGQRYRGLTAHVGGGESGDSRYRVALALNLAHHADFIVTFRQTLALSLALGIVLSGVLGWLVARRGLRPLTEIAALAQRISARHLHDRLQLERVPPELAELGEAFNSMLARLEDSFRRLSDFSSDIAHELRTPISNLLVQTQVVLSKARSAEDYREALYSSLEEYERLTRMVADMLFIAQAEHGLLAIPHASVDLAREVDDLIEFFAAVAEEKGVALRRAGTGAVTGERLLLRRALGNLIGNAIRHSLPGGTIAIGIEHAGGECRVVVENAGENIAPEHLPRLFDRFYRVDPSRHRAGEGSGLGLSIVKSIVEAHGGRVAAHSENGLTRFSLGFPASDEAAVGYTGEKSNSGSER